MFASCKQKTKQKHNELIYFKLWQSKSNGRKCVNNLNYRVTSPQQRLTHCLLEQIYHRLHAQLIIGTESHLGVEQTAALACFPLRQRRKTLFKQNWLLVQEEQPKMLWSPCRGWCERMLHLCEQP